MLDHVRCSGLELRLLDCEHSGLEIESCDHTRDAGVVCEEGQLSQVTSSLSITSCS